MVSHYNNQYDFRRRASLPVPAHGRPPLVGAGRGAARHVIDIDIYHTDEDKAAYNGGMFWHTFHYGHADTATHRSHPLAPRGAPTAAARQPITTTRPG